MAVKKAAKKRAARKAGGKKTAARARGPPPRADKGEGEGAVQARIAALKPPVRDIMAKLHALVRKHGPTLVPTVKWGHAIYLRDGKMMLIAAPRSKHVGFGYPTVSGLDDTPVNFTSLDQVDEKLVAAKVRKVAHARVRAR